MKNTSKTMYRIGNIVNIFYIIGAAILFLVGLIVAIVAAIAGDGGTAGQGGKLIGTGIYWFVAAILAFVFVGKAQRELADESQRNPAPFIVTIVFGAVSGNPFYVLAGIFGLIADSQQGQQPEVVEAKPVEEEPAQEKPAEEEPKAE